MDETVLLLILAVAAIIFAVPYALAVLLYTLPFFIFWLLIPERLGPEPQLIIDTSPHFQLAKLRGEKRDAESQYDEIRYSDWGIRWSDNLGRFEERSVRGRELNEKLEYWSAESDRISSEINETSAPEKIAVADWSSALSVWYQTHAQNAAKQVGWKSALLFSGGVWIIGELIGIAMPDFIKFFAFSWNPAPDFLHPGIAMGAAAGWAAGIYQVLHPPRSFALQAHAKIKEYADAKEIREQAEDEKLEELPSEEALDEDCDSSEDEDSQEDRYQEKDAWYEILAVSPRATRKEINDAYRERIKQYHPDRVAGLGEKLQLLAKIETQKLNAAREEGLSQHG